ncbi:hypothetical protein [Pseudomonas leptonychotis]|uniref:hypothetical protein n=1 Tax=Pseudomonas leptonychotis TaxID=2448482 RepID=UPI0039EF4FD2
MKRFRFWRIWRLLGYLLIGAAIPVGYLIWKSHSIDTWLSGFQPSEMALVQYTPEDVIGDLGGMKVHIPSVCAEYVEYDGDPGFGERRKGALPERTFDSKLKSFGVDARFPEMTCKESEGLREDYRRLRQDNPWISIGINAGSIYPKLGVKAADYREALVIESINKPSEFWFLNYEKVPGLIFGLDAYVVTGMDPNLGKTARDSERVNDVFVGRAARGAADTYITCGKTYVLGGVSSCSMGFSMEPKAKVYVDVRFARSRLSSWRDIRQSTIDFLMGFKVSEAGLKLSRSQGSGY